MKYLSQLGSATTEWLGSLFAVTFNSNESISGAAYRLRDDGRGWLYRLINLIFFWQDDHCLQSALNELEQCQELLELYDFLVVEPHYAESVEEAIDEQDFIFEELAFTDEELSGEVEVEDLIDDVEEEFWVWDDEDFVRYITGPDDFEGKRDFYNGIKEWGFSPQGVTGMSSEEYDYWAETAIEEAAAWIAEHATPAPAEHNGMSA